MILDSEQKLTGTRITGTGYAIPSILLSNELLSSRCGMSVQEIEDKTGIQSRYMVSENETASLLSARAAEDAMEDSGIVAADIDLIIGCTFSGDYRYPALACKIQDLISAENAGSFDIMANCTGFQVGLMTASDRLKADLDLKHILVVGTAVQTPFVKPDDAGTSIFFGDGAGAVIMSRAPRKYGVLSNYLTANTKVYESVRLRGGGSHFPYPKGKDDRHLFYYEMNGLEVWKQVAQNQPKVIRKALDKASLGLEDVDFFIFHQANLRLIEFLMGRFKKPMSMTHTTMERYGNTADASIAITLSEAAKEGKIKRDDIVVVSGVGAGFIFGATIIRWY